jgi:hypothetical protein
MSAGYSKKSKKERGGILDQVTETSTYSRAYAAKLLRAHGRKVWLPDGTVLTASRRQEPRRRKRKRTYGPEVAEILERLWAMLDFIASKRFVAALPELLEALERCGELHLDEPMLAKLYAISPATVDRILAEPRRRCLLKRRGRTKPGTLLKHQIPIRTYADWDDAKPGFVEVDLVGHDGGDGQGDYCQTLDLTDVATGWSEQAAVKNKAQVWVFEALQEIRARLPFPLLGLDSDNGSEFINHHLQRFCQEHGITFTRARPYRKNDTCYVEQKNWSIVRRFAGYQRFETDRERALLNELYGVVRLMTNFFCPSMKLLEKVTRDGKPRRRYGEPKTPYQRVQESPTISEQTKQDLERQLLILNPAQLHRRQIELQSELQRRGRRKPAVRRAVPGAQARAQRKAA